mgnify:CR=1 FL=1
MKMSPIWKAAWLMGLCALVFLAAGSFDTGDAPRRSPSETADRKLKKPSGTMNDGYIACRSKEWLNDVFSFLRNEDNSSLGSYIVTGKCIPTEEGEKVSVTDWGFATTEFVYNGTKYYAPTEAVNP